MDTKDIKTIKLRIGKMVCEGCSSIIETRLRETKGVIEADINYIEGTAAVKYDISIITHKEIISAVTELNYEASLLDEQNGNKQKSAVGVLIVIIALYALLEYSGALNYLSPVLLADEKTSYGMLFIIGLATSVHCVAMCGGINLSQTMTNTKNSLVPPFLYNLGRVLSYTALGFIIGGIGQHLTLTPFTQGIVKLIAGVFMIIMGLKLTGLFPFLRKFTFKLPKGLSRRINKKKTKGASPFIIGLLNGFMPCGPLQAMQIYALSTGSSFTGALSMFIFGAGTLPLMFALGAAGSIASKKFTHKAMTAGAALVTVLGLTMLTQGLSLTNTIKTTGGTQGTADITIEDGYQIIRSTLTGGRYPAITVKAGIPVKWIINAPSGSLNGCNYKIILYEYDIEYAFDYGENIIEFTPHDPGEYLYSCYMGMIRGTITVVAA